MIGWALCFFVATLLAAVIGFSGIAVVAVAGIAKVLFFVFLLLTFVALFAGAIQGEGEG